MFSPPFDPCLWLVPFFSSRCTRRDVGVSAMLFGCEGLPRHAAPLTGVQLRPREREFNCTQGGMYMLLQAPGIKQDYTMCTGKSPGPLVFCGVTAVSQHCDVSGRALSERSTSQEHPPSVYNGGRARFRGPQHKHQHAKQNQQA